MNLSLLSALLSALFFSLAGITYKLNLKYTTNDPLRLLFLVFLVQLPLTLFLVPLGKIYFPLQLWWPFLEYVLSYFFGAFLVGLAVVHLDVSVFMPLFNIQIVFTTLFSYYLLGEKFNNLGYFLMAMVIFGGFLVSYKEGTRFRKFFSRPILIFVFGLVAYALSDAFSGSIVKQFGVFNLRFWTTLSLPLVSLSLIPFLSRRERVRFRELAATFSTGLFNFLGLTMIVFGFVYSVSLSQILSRFSSVITLVIVIILAKYKGQFLERQRGTVYLVRFVGSLIMLASTAVLIFYR